MTQHSKTSLLIACGVGVGVLSGLFGVGGGIVLVPLLISVWQITRKQAHATSLAAITIIAIAGSAGFAVHGDVIWGGAAVLGATGVIGALIGGRIAQRLSSRTLGITFGVFLIVVAATLIVSPTHTDADTAPWQFSVSHALIIATTGIVAGVLSSVLGVGGGVIMIPALTLFAGMTQHTAEGTALAAMVPITIMGAITLQRNTESTPLWRYGVLLGVGGVVGAPLGSWIALQLHAATLQRAFAVFMILTAAHTIYTNWPRRHAHSPSEPVSSSSNSSA